MILKFKNIELEDKEIFENHFKRYQPSTIEYMFSTLYLWRKSFHFHWAQKDHILLINSCFPDGVAAFPPVAVEDDEFAHGMELLQDYFREKEMPFRLTEITNREKARLEKLYPGRFQFKENRNAADYVYNRSDLANLIGRSYNGKRNHIRHFKKDHPDYQFIPLTKEWIEPSRIRLEEWYESRGVENDPSLRSERQALMDALAHFGILNFQGAIIVVDDEIQAFTMGEPISDKMVCIHFEKANAEIQGIYPTINQDFVNHFWSDYEYINRAEDMGLPGLRKAKMDYKPAYLEMKYDVLEPLT